MCTEKKKTVPNEAMPASLLELINKGKQAGVLHGEELNQLLKDRSDDEVDTIYEQLSAENIRVLFNDGTDIVKIKTKSSVLLGMEEIICMLWKS